jgi:asparagine synthase (glutamine-hydrolysing)
MCGIVAVYSVDRAICEKDLQQFTESLAHRGPDLRHLWIDKDKRVGLGHARLSIIDLENGTQPISNEDGTLQIIVNGEFYDFERIRSELKRRGHRFRTGTDSEIALHLYEDYGKDALKELRGEFAFILWDEKRRTLFAARDRFGIKPLYYALVDKTIYFASEVKALFAAGVPSLWDEDSFYQQLFIFPNQDRTLFKGVFQLPPAHYLLANPDGLKIDRYWDLDYPVVTEYQQELSEEEAVGAVRDQLIESVRLRLRADVPVTVFLSGGIDSSSILGIASHVTEGQIDTSLNSYTVSFEEEEYDESHIAQETAKFAGSNHRLIALKEKDLIDHLSDAVWSAETMGINLHGVARYLLSKELKRDGYRVALTGEGSDEIFGGYIQTRHDILNLDQHRTNNRSNTGTYHALLGVAERLGIIPSWLKKVAINRSVFHLLINPDYQAQFADRDAYAYFIDQFNYKDQLHDRYPMVQSLYLWTRSILPNYTLFAERLEMANAVEVRLPFLDHKLFETVRRLPPSRLFSYREKYVLREAAKPFITERIYNRPKQPFLAPTGLFSKNGPMRDLANDLFRSSQFATNPFFDKDAVCSILNILPAMEGPQKQAFDSALLTVVCSSILQTRLFHST